MDELPELPFEKVLSYLGLADRLKARTVSRAWRNKFDSYPVNTLCYSARSSGFIWGKNRWVSGAFADNFINSTRFTTFFDTYSQTILSTLKHLRLCEIELSEEDPTAFVRILNSFNQLEELDIIRVELNQQDVFNLNLPTLTSLQLKGVKGIKKLTLEASRLRDLKLMACSGLGVEIVHGESVEWLLVDSLKHIEVRKLKSLQYLYFKYLQDNDTFLSSLPQLKEIHANHRDVVSKLFEQKRQCNRVDLKIYLLGLLLNGPDDPAMNALSESSYYFLTGKWLVCLMGNRSRLADQILFYHFVFFSDIEAVASDLEVDLLKRCTDLDMVIAYSPVQDIERFLDLLKNFNIVNLMFHDGDHPQDLFDRLPEHCAVQKLTLFSKPSDLTFLFRLKHLIHLIVRWPIDSETVRRAFDELPTLSYFKFKYGQKNASIKIGHSKQFLVSVGNKTASDLNAAIEFIFEDQ